MTALYDIAQDYLAVIDGGFVFNEDGEILFDSSNIDELKAALDDKLEACALYIKDLESDEKAISDEIEKLRKRKEQLKKKSEHLRDYVVANMMMVDVKNVETPRVTLSYRKSSFVDVYDEDGLYNICPSVFDDQKPKLSKTRLKNLLNNQNEAMRDAIFEVKKYADIEENFNLQIK